MSTGYGMHQNPMVSPHHIPGQQSMYANLQRRPSYSSETQDNSLSAQRQNSLQSPSATSPWMLPYSPTSGSLNPEFNMVPELFQSRWSQEQNNLLSQHRDSNLYRLRQDSMVHSLHQREVQMREMQFFREREAMIQRGQEEQLERERQAQQLERERQAQQVERDRQAQQLERERQAQLEREHQAQVERERQKQLREQEAKLREAQLQREKEAQAMLQREREMQMQREQRQLQIERERKNAQDMMFLQSNGGHFSHSQLSSQSPQDYRTSSMIQHFNYSNLHQDVNMQPRTSGSSGIPSFSYQSNHDVIPKSSSTLSGLGKQAAGNSHIHFPLSPPSSSVSGFGELSHGSTTTSSITSLFKKNPSLEETLLGINESSIRDQNTYVNTSPSYSKMDDVDRTIDRHLSAIKMNHQQHSEEKAVVHGFGPGTSDVYTNETASICNQISHNVEATEKTSSNFSSFSQSSAPTDPKDTMPSVTFSHQNAVQVTQNSAVNINININMPPHTNFPFSVSDLPLSINSSPHKLSTPQIDVTSKTESPVEKSSVIQTSVNASNAEITVCSVDTPMEVFETGSNPEADGQVLKSVQGTASVSLIDSSSSITSSIPAKKSKQSFSSIETFLGMSSPSTSTTVIENKSVVSETSLEHISSSPMEKQDRISVIKPVATAQVENQEKKNGGNSHLNQEKTSSENVEVVTPKSAQDRTASIDRTKKKTELHLPLHPSARFKSSQRSNEKPARKQEKQLLHPSMRLKQNTSKPSSPILKESPEKAFFMKPGQRYQSETLKNSKKDTVSPQSNIAKSVKAPVGGKPLNYAVPGGKPASYTVPGGKPSSYALMNSKRSTPTGGKPLSYLKSVCESKPSTKTSEKPVVAGKGRGRKKGEKKSFESSQSSPTTKTSTSKETIPKPKVVTKSIKKPLADSKVDNEKVSFPELPQHNQNKRKIGDCATEATIPVSLSPDVKKKKIEHSVTPTSGKPFQFKEITFDAKKNESDSNSDSDSSSSSDEDTQGKQSFMQDKYTFFIDFLS